MRNKRIFNLSSCQLRREVLFIDDKKRICALLTKNKETLIPVNSSVEKALKTILSTHIRRPFQIKSLEKRYIVRGKLYVGVDGGDFDKTTRNLEAYKL